MMTICPISGAAEAAEYYDADDYYFSKEDGSSPSVWFGRGAEVLGLTGEVDRTIFRKALDGSLPDGSVLAGGRHGERRPGWDCTFSAPKSVSMQALIAGDHRLGDAHNSAVDAALRYFEKEVAGYRESAGGTIDRFRSECVLVAQFRHELSRNVDPQLHTHAVLLNAVPRQDGEWRCLDAAGLFKQQKTVGAVYRAELARRVVELGYAIRNEHVDGRFELANITREQIDTFSTRRRAIEQAHEDAGIDITEASPRQREIIALATRRAKSDVDRTAVWRQWSDRANAIGVDFTPIAPDTALKIDRQEAVKEAVSFAIEHTTERSAVVEHHQLLGAALGHLGGLGGADAMPEIEAELSDRAAQGTLVQDESRYTSADAVATEQKILDIERAGRGAVASIVPQLWFLDTEVDTFNADQRRAARAVLTSCDRVSGIHGWAGTGKTTLLDHIRGVASDHGYRLLGLAPSAAAAHELGKARIAAETIAAFISRGTKLTSSTVVVLDEAGMVGARDMKAVLLAVEVAGCRIVLVGDQGQLKAVSAGAPFQQLQANGMATEQLKLIVRQKNVVLGEAVTFAARREVRAAVERLKGTTAEITSAEARWNAIARQYVKLTPVQRKETVIVSGTNRAREEINAAVRLMLGIQGTGSVFQSLRSRNLTDAEKRCTASYRAGDVVVPTQAYKSLGLRRGEQARVLGCGAGKITLQRPDGTAVEWQPATTSKVGVYQLGEIELARGDLVRHTANDYGLGVLNGDVLTIDQVDHVQKIIVLRDEAGATMCIPTDKALHIEHGYASTVYAAQGRTSDRVIIDACTRSACAHEASFYVAISRARSECWIYTDDRDALPEAMSRADVKSKALDVAHAAETAKKRAGAEMSR
jgi:conjugative relaxase-like TrwC/TraI family protein